MSAPDYFVAQALLPHKVRWHFVLNDYESGDRWEGGETGRWPICSCFKLAVLGAWMEQPATRRRLQTCVTLTKSDMQPGGGLLNQLPSPITLRVEQLLTLMISHSDGTSTDWLIRALGMDAVSAWVASHVTDSNVSTTLGDVVRWAQEAVADAPPEELRPAYGRSLRRRAETMDYTNALDLVRILECVWAQPDCRPFLCSPHEHKLFQAYPRTDLQIVGKTGSFGHGWFVHDSAIILRDGRPVGCTALLTEGWNAPKVLIEHLFGELLFQLSRRWSSQPSVRRGPMPYQLVSADLAP